ncbi:MAG: type II toxin-antitoxin system HipA family toxin [Alcanivorax sp.]|nr:type II toxin-antitoxin system HipA family toxin [Alcanivorax sp.]
MQQLAEVRLWDQFVGALAYDTATGLGAFEYSRAWLANGFAVAPLHLPLTRSIFTFPGLNRETWRGVPAAFADTLPDDFGNAVIDAWLARQGRDPASFTPLERLLYTGSRGMGALEYAPALDRAASPEAEVALASLVRMAQSVLDQRAGIAAAPGNEDDEGMRALLQVGTSAGGARPKALVAINAERTELRSGQLPAPAGFQHYLLKFDGVVEGRAGSELSGDPLGYGRMEYAYYLMACDAGLDMSPSEVLEDGPRAHFMTRRFDREGNRKHHYLSLCAMDHADYKAPGAYSYEQLLATARKLRLPRRDAVEIFRRMVFNVVARNHDDHAKNFGFLLTAPDAGWRLAPAFDVAYSYKPGSPWVNSHQLSLNGKRDDFVRDDLLAVAALIGNFQREAVTIIEQVTDIVAGWEGYADKAGVFPALRREIARHHRLSLR